LEEINFRSGSKKDIPLHSPINLHEYEEVPNTNEKSRGTPNQPWVETYATSPTTTTAQKKIFSNRTPPLKPIPMNVGEFSEVTTLKPIPIGELSEATAFKPIPKNVGEFSEATTVK